MIVELRSRQLMHRYDVDCGYLQEDNAFEVNRMLPNWPAAENLFLVRAARNAEVGCHVELGLEAFVAYVGQLALSLPDGSAAVFDLELTTAEAGSIAHANLSAVQVEVTPPIEADNPGFLHYALTWFTATRPEIRLYVMQGIFWVEAAAA